MMLLLLLIATFVASASATMRPLGLCSWSEQLAIDTAALLITIAILVVLGEAMLALSVPIIALLHEQTYLALRFSALQPP